MKYKKKIFHLGVVIFFVIFSLLSLPSVLSSSTNSYLYLKQNYIAVDKGENFNLIAGLFDYKGLHGCAEVAALSLALCQEKLI